MVFNSIILQATPATRLAWESLYNLYAYLGIASAIVTFAMIIYFCVRYRARAGSTVIPSNPKTRENRDAKLRGPILIYVLMAIILISVGSQSLVTYAAFSRVPSTQNTIHINVVGHQFVVDVYLR